jgi:hypothetical protein
MVIFVNRLEYHLTEAGSFKKMDFDTHFLIFIFSVFAFFGFFTHFLLSYRKKLLLKNTSLTSSDAWNSLQPHANDLGPERSNLIYAIYQDHNNWSTSMTVNNHLDQEIAKTIHPLIKRQKIMIIGDENYVITYHLTWKKVITFKKEGTDEVLATWSENGRFGKHAIEIPSIGTIVSSRVSLDFRVRYKYTLHGKNVGLIENTFNRRPMGRIAILSDSIPATVRAFMLSK